MLSPAMANSPKFLTPEEVDRLFRAAASNPRNIAILRVAYHRGLTSRDTGTITEMLSALLDLMIGSCDLYSIPT